MVKKFACFILIFCFALALINCDDDNDKEPTKEELIIYVHTTYVSPSTDDLLDITEKLISLAIE